MKGPKLAAARRASWFAPAVEHAQRGLFDRVGIVGAGAPSVIRLHVPVEIFCREAVSRRRAQHFLWEQVEVTRIATTHEASPGLCCGSAYILSQHISWPIAAIASGRVGAMAASLSPCRLRPILETLTSTIRMKTSQ